MFLKGGSVVFRLKFFLFNSGFLLFVSEIFLLKFLLMVILIGSSLSFFMGFPHFIPVLYDNLVLEGLSKMPLRGFKVALDEYFLLVLATLLLVSTLGVSVVEVVISILLSSTVQEVGLVTKIDGFLV